MIAGAASLSIVGLAWAQGRGGGQPQGPTPNVSTDPLLRGFSFRSIGPANMMGRVDDIEGAEKDTMIVYAGFATGGLWKSTDGGSHWLPLFENMPNESIGSIGIAPSNPDVVYVGMGEGNNRQSASIGDGVWGTTDGGKTWNHLGLEETQSIQRVVVDPTNPNIVYVAAGGHLFGPNPERGLYKSVDGGKNWTKSKFIDNDTGFTDVAIDPSNPKILYAASYQRRRTWWGMNGGGPGSAMWKTTDAGATWTKIDGAGWAKPKDGVFGRMAISIFKAKPSIVYAQVEAGASGGTGAGTGDNGLRQVGRGGAAPESGIPAVAPPGGAPAGGAAPAAGAAGGGRGGAGGGGGGGRGGNGLGSTPPDPATGVYRSEDGGKTWTQVSHLNDRPMYFSQIRVDPVNDKKLFVGGNPARMSIDGGKTWTNVTGSHTDYHAFWINPKEPRIVFVGHDGGIDSSNDGGQTWDHHNDMAVGQFYQVSADMRRPYWVCGGLQDNNAWCGPSALRAGNGPVNSDWFTVAGGDGFYTRQDPMDWAIVYGESQDGGMSRHDLRNGTQKSIRPTVPGRGGRGGAATATETATGESTAADDPAAAGGRGGGGGGRGGTPNVLNAPPNVEPLRFYWNAPIEISPHNPAVIYMASQYFFKSKDRGDTWWMNPKDLSKNIDRWAPEMAIMGVSGEKPMASKHDGYAASSTATQIRESPSKPGVIWIGFEDGNLQVSQDGGETFTSVYDNIKGNSPKGYTHISRIEPSHFDPATAYVAIDHHRYDDWKPYLFKTTDYGKTWTNVTGNLPAKGNINALREDYDNPNLLFVGTEFGLYVTLDGCKEFKKFMTGLPSVRVDDILIHPRDRDLIIATHGRSIWIADDISALEQMKPGTNVSLFDPRPAVEWKSDLSASRNATNRDFVGKNPQGGTAFSIWAKEDMGPAKFEVLQGTTVIGTYEHVQQGVLETGTTGEALSIKAGMNRFQWGMRGAPVVAANAAGGRGRNGGRGGRGGANADAAAGGAAATGEAQPPATPPATPDTAGAAFPGGGGGGGGRGGRGGQGGVPFVGRGGGGGGGGGGFGGGAAQGNLVEPGTYMVRLTIAGNTWTTSVNVLEDIWMRPQ
jgi:photosystem II stability/assembly factor-like uncharacterized protein